MGNEAVFSNKKRNRADQLQFLRFLAFGLIFLLHSSVYGFSWFPGNNGAACAVSFFFILSGLVTSYSSYEREIELTVGNIRDFVWKKIKKVYPLYLVTTLVSVSYSGVPNQIALHEWRDLGYSLTQLLKSLLLIQSWFPGGYFSFNGVGWFLSTIMFLYLLTLPLLATAQRIRKSDKSNLIFAGIFVVGALLTVLYSYLMKATKMEFTQYILPPARIGEYVCGMCLGMLLYPTANGSCESGTELSDDCKASSECSDALEQDSRMTFRKVIYTFAEATALIFWLASMYIKLPKWTFRTVHWLIPNFVLLIVFTLGKGYISQIFKCRFLVLLGNLSFGCFLIHQIVIYFYTQVSGIETNGVYGNVFSLAFCLLITVMLAYAAADDKVKHTIIRN